MRARLSVLLSALLLGAACDRPEPFSAPVDPSLESAFSAAASPPHSVGVLNWNVYVGADVDIVIEALATPDPSDDLTALLAGLATFAETDWPSRASAIADEIARHRPHVVGLQELTEVAIDLTPLGLPVVVQQDFLATLEAELAARDLDYVVAVVNTNIVAAPFPGIHLADHDALLVDASRVTVLATAAASFANNIGVVAPGIELKRGWVLVDAAIGGTTYRFVNTHLESGPGAQLTGLRTLQALELVAVIGAAEHAVLMGDLNEDDTSPMYGVLMAAGFTDAWRSLRPGAEGLTCCHLPDLSNKRQQFDERIDYVLTRGIGRPGPGLQGKIDRLGEVPADRIAGPSHPIWPSDHAGLLVELLSPARGSGK
jgi:endonuclease/exonuclease/phosphatase family metal-dependent hydrolase